VVAPGLGRAFRDGRAAVTRECGSCSACCQVLEVRATGSAAWSRCASQRDGGGCASYETRPECCARYRCLWLDGEGEEEDRPDRAGVILDAGLTSIFQPTWGPGAVCVREVSAGSSRGTRARRLISNLVGEGRAAFLKTPDGQTICLSVTIQDE